jgi:UDP-N-acetylglucosamine 2-epimerase (non-hydrolysing)
MAPVIAATRERFGESSSVVVHTGQHYDRAMSEIFFEELGVPEPDHMLGVGSGSHGEQTARVLERLEPVLRDERPDLVLVPGDVNSTLAAALCASRRGIPVGHVESGLRSFDRTMPEEINRIVADHLSELLFLHSPEAEDNLRAEGIDERGFRFVGNTMIDTLVALEGRIRERGAARAAGLEPGSYLLVTLHRPALVDGPLLGEAIGALESVAAELPVLFPVHPRTRKMLGERGAEGITLIDPVGYLDFLSLEADAAGVLTDSGGIQEETTILDVPCLTIRPNTERPITISHGTNRLVAPTEVAAAAREILAGPVRPSGPRPPLWDGHAGERIADVVEGWLGSAATLTTAGVTSAL